MRYVVTGGAGHISGIVAEKLLAAGKDVTVVGRSAANLQKLADKGAKTAIGSLEDAAFVNKTFAGADAVFTLIPPNFATDDYTAYQKRVGNIFFDAIKNGGVKYVVNLSSVGAHLNQGVGVVNGMGDAETQYKTLTNVQVKNLRPGSFYYNFFSQIPMVKAYGALGSNYHGDKKVALVAPADIAAVAVEELLALNFTGNTVRYIASEYTTMHEAAKILGAAIGKPDLKWNYVPSKQLKDGMLQGGLKETMANGFVEMGESIESGKFFEDYVKHQPVLGPTKLKDFAADFAAAYNAPAGGGH